MRLDEQKQKFGESSLRVLAYARGEALRLKQGYMGTEHLLLGLIKLGEGRAVEALCGLGLDLNDLRRYLEDVVPPSGKLKKEAPLPVTARYLKVLEFSLHETGVFHSKGIEAEHLLLSILKEGEGVAAQVLATFGAGYHAVLEKLKEISA